MQLNRHLKFDIIITGAGIASFTAAIILQKFFKKKTAIVTGITTDATTLENSFYFDSFYSGQMENDNFVRKIFDYLTDNKLLWERLPSVYERHFYPKAKLNISDNLAQYMDGLKKLFPKERGNVDSFFKDIQHAANYTSFYLLKFILPLALHKITERFFASGKRFSTITSEEYLQSLTSDSNFKTTISGQMQNLASCREGTAAIFQAINMMGLLNGGFAPFGGIRAIYKTLMDAYKSAGGIVFENNGIDELVLSGNKVKEIKLKNNQEDFTLKAGRLFWGLGVASIPKYLKKDEEKERLTSYFSAREFVPFPVVFRLKFNEKSEKLNLKGEVLRFFPANSADSDEISQGCNLYPDFTTSTNESLPTGYFAAVFIGGEDPENFLSQESNIEDLKEYLLGMIERYIPELKKCIDSIEEIPATSIGRGGLFNPYGSIMPSTQKIVGEPAKNPYKLNNLFITGSDLFIPGITPSVMSGVTSVGMALGAFRFFKFFRYLKKSSNKKVKVKIKPLKYKKGWEKK